MKRKNQLIEKLYKRIADLEAENEILKDRLQNSTATWTTEPPTKLEKIKYIKEKTNCDLRTAVDAQNMFYDNISDAVQYAIKIKKQKEKCNNGN